jgi:beta-galactosidase
MRRMLTNMINQHYNHPAVIMWGLGNEQDWPGNFPTFDEEEIRWFLSELNEQAHALDPSRYTSIRRCRFCPDIADVYSPTIWVGWYNRLFTEYRAVTEREMKKVGRFSMQNGEATVMPDDIRNCRTN